MKKKATTILTAGLLAMLVMAPVQAMAGKAVLQTQLCYSAAMPILGETITYFADKVKEASDGQMVFKLYDPGKLVPPSEILESVSKGRIQAGYSNPGFWAGKLPAGPLFSSIPFGPEAPEFVAWMYHGNGMKLYQEMYDRAGYNVKAFPINIVPPETAGWYTKEINSVDDLKGLKIRFFGLGGEAMQKLGAAVSMMPAGEIFPALEKRALDATEFSMPLVDKNLGFYKVCKYNYFPGWHQQATINELIINKDYWEKELTPSQRTLIEMCSMATVLNMLAKGEASQASVLRNNAEKLDVKNMYFSEDMIQQFEKAWGEVAVEQSEKDPFFKKVYEDLQAFRKDYSYWARFAFLPRHVGPENK